MPFFDVQNGQTTGDQSLWNQFSDAFTAKQDADVQLFAQLSPPAAPTVSVNTTSGNLTGNYQYALAFETGYWEGPVGSGTLYTKGNTGGGTASVTVSPNGQQANISIPSAPQGVVNVFVYRTKANGSTFYYLTTVQANTSTQITDNALDSALGAQMPTTNTTGGKFIGDGSQLTGIPKPSDATTSAPGLVEIADAPSGTHPVAITTDNAAYKAVNLGNYITAGTGIVATPGTNQETIALATTGTAGTYTKVTTDAYGRVSSGAHLASSDVTSALGYTPLNSTAQAADSAKLNGQPASYYAPASSVKSGYEFEVATFLQGIYNIYMDSQSTSATTPASSNVNVQAVSGGASNNILPKVLINEASSGATYMFEGQLAIGSSGNTAYAGLWDLTSNTIVSGSTISSTTLSTNQSSVTPIRSGAVTLIPGHVYAPTVWTSNSSYYSYLYSARIVGQM